MFNPESYQMVKSCALFGSTPTLSSVLIESVLGWLKEFLISSKSYKVTSELNQRELILTNIVNFEICVKFWYSKTSFQIKIVF